MSTNEESILMTTKRTLGLAEDYTVFDEEIATHINSVFGDLHQLGIGPADGFEIESAEAKWEDFVDDPIFSGIKSYMTLRVKMLFDPPTLGYLITAYEKMIEKAEWRLNVAREDQLVPSIENEIILDGGP